MPNCKHGRLPLSEDALHSRVGWGEGRVESPSSSDEDNYQGYDMVGFKPRMEDKFEKDFQQIRPGSHPLL